MSSLFGGGERPPGPPTITASALVPLRRLAQADIDPRGDLVLIVGRELEPEPAVGGRKAPEPDEPEPIAFRVCSRTVARASAPFDAMLFRGFSESIRPEPSETEPTEDPPKWTVRLPDDDPGAMRFLLATIHGRFDDLDLGIFENTGGLRNLYRVAVLTDKYDMTGALRPWAVHLTQLLESIVLDLDALDLEKALWVSWELGSETAFRRAIHELVWDHPKRAFSTFAPPGAEEAIRASRNEAIAAVLAPVKQTIDAMVFGRGTPWFRCAHHASLRSSCNLIILGSIMHSLGRNGLWPLPSGKEWGRAVAELKWIINGKVTIQLNEGHRWCYTENAGPEPTAPDVVLTVRQREHMALQAGKLGLAAPALSACSHDGPGRNLLLSRERRGA